MSCGQYSTLCINYTVHVTSKTLMMKITLCLTKIIILFSVVPYRFEEGSYLSTITVEADFLQKARYMYMYMSIFIFLLCIIACFIHGTCAWVNHLPTRPLSPVCEVSRKWKTCTVTVTDFPLRPSGLFLQKWLLKREKNSLNRWKVNVLSSLCQTVIWNDCDIYLTSNYLHPGLTGLPRLA